MSTLAGTNGSLEERRKVGAGGSGLDGDSVGFNHLTQNLIFSDNLGIQTGRHPAQVLHHLHAGQRIQMGLQIANRPAIADR